MAAAFRVLILLLLCLPAYGQQRVDLYQAELLVPNQSQRERNQATVDGLAEVLVRTSGQPGVLENPEVVSALGRASNYLVEWRYENSDETLTIDGEEVPASRLVLRYSGNAIEKLLREQRLPIWPSNRPSTLLWLMVDDAEGRKRVSSSSSPPVMKAVEASAKRRGLPIIKPLWDLEDQVALPADALWSFDQAAVREASERYNPDATLVGRLTETSSGQWRASWMLLHRDRSTLLDSDGMELDDVIAAGIDQVANHFFQLYGITPQEGSGEALVFQIDGVEDFAAYSRVNDYLSNLAVISRYDLVAVHGGSMLLYVYPAADLAQLRDALALDERMLPTADLSPSGLPPGSSGNPLRFRWR